MLPSDDVIDLERRRVERGGQMTVFAARIGLLPNAADEIRIQGQLRSSGFLEGPPRLRLYGRHQIGYMDIAIQLSRFFRRQLALLRQFGQLIHTAEVSFIEPN